MAHFLDSKSIDENAERVYVTTPTGRRKRYHNQDSVLSRNGYVADGSMNAEERQQCIAMILEKGLATKSMIINHLANLIDINGIRCYAACQRWEADLRFVNRYAIESQRKIGAVDTFKRRR